MLLSDHELNMHSEDPTPQFTPYLVPHIQQLSTFQWWLGLGPTLWLWCELRYWPGKASESSWESTPIGLICSNKHSTWKTIYSTLTVCRAQCCAKCRGEIKMSIDRAAFSWALVWVSHGGTSLILTHLRVPKPSEMGVVVFLYRSK